MFEPGHNQSPFNDIPPVIVGLVAIVGLIELVFQAGAAGLAGGPNGVGWRIDAIERFGFFDTVFDWMRETGNWPLEGLVRFLTYPFVHFGGMHALLAAVLLLAMGKFVAERFAVASVLAIMAFSSIAGALAYGLLVDENMPLLGLYPAVYGLIGAFTFVMLLFYEATGQNRARAFQMIGILVGLQLIFNMMGGGAKEWIADTAGFIAGFTLSFAMAPDGIRRLRQLLDKSRQR